MQDRKINRGKIIAISVMLAIVLALSVVAGVLLYREKQLNDLQREALQELEENSGEYDEQKIVLCGTSESEAKMLAEKFNAALRITFDGKFATLTLPEGTTVKDVYSERSNRKYLSETSLDYYAKTSAAEERITSSANYTVTDTYYSLQSYLSYLNIGDAWTTTRGSGITVAIIDTGIDTDHSEFAGRISAYSYNATEDKIVKDYTADDGGYDWSLIEDEQGHGTSVAGVIAASMDGSGTVGIASEVNLLIIKAECDENGNFYNASDLVFGLYYAIEMDADVVNMSFGTYGVNSFATATKLAVDSDIICVAAAGNDATTALCYPAADENVIGVGALTENSWELASYSNYGENSDIVAPGTTYTTKMGGGYGVVSGTSLASPVAAGAVALYLSQNRYSEFTDVVENLYASCYDLGSLGDDWEYGYGALDINALICEQRGSVTFDMLTDELDDIEQIFVVNHTLQNLPEPERTYAVFDGWYYDIECTEELNWYEDVFTSDLTLYAKWVNEDDGIPYTYVTLDDGTVEIRSYTGKRRYITIPDTIDGKVVSSIGDEAFSGQTRLRQVNLPSGLTNIGRNAFYNCSNLLEIEIPEGVTTIGSSAFYNCTRLSSVAFTGSSKLTTVGDYAFAYSGLTRFELPSNLNSINGSAFYGDTSLKAITVVSGNTCFCADGGVLFNYTKSTIVAYPAGLSSNIYIVPESVRTINVVAFAYAKIKSIDFTNVTTIGDSAFIFSSLESLTISDCVISLGSYAFAYNFYLKAVTIGDGLTVVSGGCFSNCSMLTSIEIPAGIISIDGEAFSSTGLTRVTFENGSNLLYIGIEAFYYTPITEIIIPASVISIGGSAFASDYYLSSVTFEIGGSLQVIGGGAFSYDISLVDINLPNTLLSIGDSAFYYNISLMEISLPENLQTIGEYAFQESGLKTVTLPASLISLGAGAFASCHSLTEINVESTNTVYTSIDGVVYTIDKTVVEAYPAGNSATAYTIESTVTTVGEAAFYGSWNLITVNMSSVLVTISDYAFYDCENITVYTLPEGLVEIGDYAMAYNISLKSLAMPDSLYQIGKYSVYGDYALTSITFNETSTLPRISYGSFSYCGITSFRVPASVSTMAQGAFQGCDSLISITFAANSKLSYISAYMFDGCSSLQTITFESGTALTSIQAHGLEGMTNLVSVDFGDAKLTNIDNYAFRYCESLITVTIPEGVTYIGRYAFYGCNSLESLVLPESIDYIGRYAFYAYGGVETNIYFKGENLPDNLQENWDYGIGGYYVGVTDVTTSGDWSYAVTNNGNISIIKYNGSETAIDLTAIDLGGDITSIGGYAFYNTDVSSIVLPETLTSIQRYAFARSAITEVTIPDSVTFIGQYAFFYTPLTAITFGENSGLKKIEQYAFYYTKSLTSVTLPASLTSLGSYAFYYSGITRVTFADGINLTEISAYAFANSGLTSVTLPDSVTYINDNAFRNCENLTALAFGAGEDIEIHSNAFYNTGLTYLYIPANVRYIGEYAFVGLTSLTAFEVSEDNPNYSSYEGLLYNKDQSKLIAVPAAKTGTIYLPESLETIGFGAFENTAAEAVVFDDNCNLLAIGYRAFYNAQNLTSVYIPASVVTIDFYAFAMCSNLTTVTFAEGSRLTGVYEGAFYGCMSLENIVLPDSIIEISDYAFYGCSSLKAVPISETSGLKGIYDYAFAYSGITELILPETVIDIGDYAFRGCKLKYVYIPDTNATALIIGIGAFADCEEMTEITLPFIGASYEDDEITWFGYIFGAGGYAANSTYVPASLKTVTITEGITFIGTGAFYGIETIEKINIPYSVTMVYVYSFYMCGAAYEFTNTISLSGKSLTQYYFQYYDSSVVYDVWNHSEYYTLSGSLNLAEGITSVDYYALTWCGGLTSITLQEGVTYIDDCAFLGCTFLTNIVIPDSVTYIGSQAFQSCNSLTNVTFGENSKLTSIGTFAFGECSSLSNIEIPNGVSVIENGVFYLCYSLTSVTIPSGVTSIEYYAFMGCDKLYQIINYSDLVFTIGSRDYEYIAINAKLIIDKNGNKMYLDESTGFTYVDTTDNFRFIYENGAYTLTAYLGTDTTVTLPSDINGENYTLYYMSGVVNVIIPETFTQISEYAFYKCTSLSSVVIPDTVKSIGDYAFAGCSSLTIVEIPEGVTSIGRDAFAATNTYSFDEYETIYSDSNLKKVTLPGTVTSIGYGAFSGCINLEEINIPAKLTQIESNVFMYCEKLSSIDIPSGVTKIYGYAFAYCRSLSSISLPDELTMIGGYAFYNCSNLKDIEFPSGVTNIGTSAFSGTMLADISIDEGNAYFYADGGILYNADKTKIVFVSNAVTSVIIPNTITDISSAFYGCVNLTAVYFEAGSILTSIGSYAFYGCSSLNYIEIPDYINSIEYYAFYGCSSLTSLEIPDSVTYIAGYAFYSCSGLISIEIPNTVTSIGDYSFYDCSSLSSIEISSKLTDIGSGAFGSCEALTAVYFGGTISEWTKLVFEDIYTNPLYFAGNLYISGKLITDLVDSDITSIGSCTFAGWNITSITIPDTVTVIGSYAFYNCDSLVSVTIGNSVESIGSNAFGDCDLLSEITIGESVATIGYGTFINSPKIYQITNYSNLDLTIGSSDYGNLAYNAKLLIDKNGNKTYKTEDSEFAFIETTDGFRFMYENGIYTLISYMGTEETVTLPTEINGSTYFLYYVRGIKNVIIPEGFTTIDSFAFCQDTELESVVIADSVTSIEQFAFYLCSGLKSVTFGNNSQLQDIGYDSFSRCYNLTGILLPENLTSIDEYAFAYCSSLSNIYIPSSVTKISSYAFYDTAYYNNDSNWTDGCLFICNCLIEVNSSLKFVDASSATCIAYNAFDGCYSLTQVAIGGNHSNLLYSLTNLETLIITEMPTTYYISDYFGGSIPLTLQSIVIKDTAEIKGSYFFNNITGITIFVEREEVNIIWNEFYLGWNNGNTVIYGGKFITAEFYDSDGTILSSSYYKTSQVIRQPYVSDYVSGAYRYTFIGWDTNGDGAADFIPATSTSDITATALYSAELRCVTEDHSWNNGEITTEATCTTDGIIIYICGYCGETYTEVIPATGHTAGEAATENCVAATCTTDGSYDLVVYCSVCSEEISRETVIVPATGHTASEVVTENYVAATCTTDGSYDLVVYCSVCGEEISCETITIPATGHTAGEAATENCVAATCTTDGSYDLVVYCSVCSEEISCETITIPATGHTASEAVTENYVAATCTTDGSYDLVVYCSVCGEKISCETVIVPATGHTASEAVTENYVAATCATDGSYDLVVYCSVCSEEISRETITIPVTGHTSSDWIVDKEAEEGVSGHRHKECTECGEILEEEDIAALPITSGGETDDSGSGEIEDGSSGGSGGDNKTSGCGSVIGSDEGGSNLSMVAFTMLAMAVLCILLRQRKNKIR